MSAAREVANTLGAGLLEKVYERALVRELSLRRIRVRSQVAVKVVYKGQLVGDYFTDLLVEDAVIVEVTCADHLGEEHLAQCLNHLRASGRQSCLLINFRHAKVEWKRIVSEAPQTEAA